jgi:hypothetical protein
MPVGARCRSPLVVLLLAAALATTMLPPTRATAFVLPAAARGPSRALLHRPSRLAVRMGLDRSSRPTPRGPGFRFVGATRGMALGSSGSSTGDGDFAAIEPQTLNWEKVGPEEDVFISALSQNGHVRAQTYMWGL